MGTYSLPAGKQRGGLDQNRDSIMSDVSEPGWISGIGLIFSGYNLKSSSSLVVTTLSPSPSRPKCAIVEDEDNTSFSLTCGINGRSPSAQRLTSSVSLTEAAGRPRRRTEPILNTHSQSLL